MHACRETLFWYLDPMMMPGISEWLILILILVAPLLVVGVIVLLVGTIVFLVLRFTKKK